MTPLPEIARKRNQDSQLFGVVAFTVANVVGKTLAVTIQEGGAKVWLPEARLGRRMNRRSQSSKRRRESLSNESRISWRVCDSRSAKAGPLRGGSLSWQERFGR
jgi:hypothetical protein